MTHKARIVDELGESAVLLPESLNRALSANDRVKYYLTLLQTARSHADEPAAEVSDLRHERLASGVRTETLDAVVAGSRKEAIGVYHIPQAARLKGLIFDGVAEMIAPIQIAGDADGADAAGFVGRLETLGQQAPELEDNRLPGDFLDAMTSGHRERGDSLHLLVIDLHRKLHRLQGEISHETLAGARVYGLDESDRPLVEAFTRGVRETAVLKFDHPGLGTTATRSGEKLILQNDIGETDAHVLVVHVVGLETSVTYTDVHLPRVRFFQSFFEPFAVRWSDTRSRSARGLGKGDRYYLAIGSYTATEDAELVRFLEFLGSRLVFLIDWNRARKRLRRFLKKAAVIVLLRWAAENRYGHRAFLKLGGEKLIYKAMEFASAASLSRGERLDELLGREVALDYLKFVLRTAAEGLLEGQSKRLIRDQIQAELAGHFKTTEQGLLTMAARLAGLIFEIACGVRDGLARAPLEGANDLSERNARRAVQWETQADEVVDEGRDLVRRSTGCGFYLELLEQADAAADRLEESAFLLTLSSPDGRTGALQGSLQNLAGLQVEGAQEFVKCLHTAGFVHRGGAREDLKDFLEAVDRIVTIEHRSDDAYRRITAELFRAAVDFRQLELCSRIARALDKAADALKRSSLLLRYHILSE